MSFRKRAAFAAARPSFGCAGMIELLINYGGIGPALIDICGQAPAAVLVTAFVVGIIAREWRDAILKKRR